MAVNKAIVIGNLGRDPEMRYTQDGSAVANFTVATSERWTDRGTNEKREQTEWHRVVCFRRLAEICGEYLRKGSKVYIEGRLQTRSWEGQDGQTRYTTEIIAREMQMLDSRGGGGGGGYQSGDPGPAAAGIPDDMGQNSGMGQGSGRAQSGGGRRAPQAQQPQPAAAAEDDDFEDDIPF